jgi:hypothetical protein
MRIRLAVQLLAVLSLAALACTTTGCCCAPICAGLEADQCESVPGCTIRRSYIADPKGGGDTVDCVAKN